MARHPALEERAEWLRLLPWIRCHALFARDYGLVAGPCSRPACAGFLRPPLWEKYLDLVFPMRWSGRAEALSGAQEASELEAAG